MTHLPRFKLRMARLGVSERSKIDSFIVMDLMRDATAKQRDLQASGTHGRTI